MDFDCVKLLHSIPDNILRGGSKLEVVFLCGSPCVQRVFLDYGCQQSESAVSIYSQFQDGDSKLEVFMLCTILF